MTLSGSTTQLRDYAIRGYLFFSGVIIGTAAGFALTLALVVPWAGGTRASDWLQFFGALVGAGTAVVGAIFVERWKRRQQTKEARLLVAHAIEEAIKRIDEPRPPYLDLMIQNFDERRRVQLDLVDDISRFEGALDKMTSAQVAAPLYDLISIFEAKAITDILAERVRMAQSINRDLDDVGISIARQFVVQRRAIIDRMHESRRRLL